MSIEYELTSIVERTLEEHIMPYAEMKAIRDTLGSMLKEFSEKHKSMDAEIRECFDMLDGAVDFTYDTLPSLDKLRADLTQQLLEERGNVERYADD